MSEEEKKRKEEELNNLYSDAKNDSLDMNNQLLALPEDFPDMPELEMYDYDKDLEESLKEGKEVIDNMAGLYLNNNTEILNHPYLLKKKQHDADNQADILFLKKMSKRALIMQLRSMDMGDTSPRHFETFYTGLREIREINKQSTSSQNLMETFYKTLKNDLGLEDKPIETTQTEKSVEGNTTDQKSLNDKLRDLMKKKKS